MPTLPKNPFENLFGEGAPATIKTTPKTNVKRNPFEGLFEAKAQPEIQQKELDQFGLPKSYISAAPAGTTFKEPEVKESFWTKAARAVLPKSLEDFFGISVEAQKKKAFEKKYEEAYAYEDLQKLQKELEAGGGKLPTETAGEVLKETKPEKYLPFVSAIPDIVSAVQVYQSAKRLEAGEETMVDLYRLTKFRSEQEQDQTFMAKVTSVLTELPSFGAELLLTGGIYTVGKEATEKAISETLEKTLGKTAGRIISKSAANIVGGTLQTIPARAVEITAGTIQNMIPDYGFTTDELGKLEPVITGEGDDLWKALIKSGANQWVEVVTEHSGGLLTEMTAPLKNQLLKVAILKSFLKANPTATSIGFMNLVKRAGWNGVLGEMFEERAGELARGVLSELGLSDEGWVLPSKEQLAIELVSFSVPGIMISTSNKALQAAGQTIQEALTPKESEPGAPKPITMAESVIGARDILIVGKGGTDVNTDLMTGLQAQINSYHDEVAEPVIEILDTDRTTLANIKVVPYPDGKWGYSYEINTPENGISSDFLSNKLSATREEAVALAKNELLIYARGELSNVSDETKTDFEDIVKHIERVEPGSDVPFEVRKQEKIKPVKTEGQVEAPTAAIKTTRDAAKDLIRTYVERGDTVHDLSKTQGGNWSSDYHASIGGYVNGKRIGTDKIIVEQIGKQKLDPPQVFSLKELYDEIKNETPTTQKERVAEAVKEQPKTIKEVAEETKILEPNVRRILGVGAKDGTFERVDKGVYILRKDGKDIAYIETGDAVEVLPRLAFTGSAQGLGYFEKMKRDLDHFTASEREGEMIAVRYPNFFNPKFRPMMTREQIIAEINEMLDRNGFKNTEDFYNFIKTQDKPFKADMVFLDIPYKTAAVTGKNRGAKFDFITPDEFATVVNAVKEIARDDKTAVFYMFSNAPSGMKDMQKYTDKMTDAGFKPVARGEYTKLQKDGITRTRNMRGVPDYPEGIILFTKSGEFDKENPDLNFKLVRPMKGWQTEKPAEMAMALIEMSTEEGEVVLDPFAGSGVVPAEAVKAGREAVAIEKSEKALAYREALGTTGKIVEIPTEIEAATKTNREKILDEYRQSILPEYNTNEGVVALDAFVDKIRELDPKDESDAIQIKHGNKYEATISYPHSLGEMGNQTDFIYKEKPTTAQIKVDIIDTYEQFKKDVNEPLGITGIVAKSGRDENIEAAIDKVFSPAEVKPTPRFATKDYVAIIDQKDKRGNLWGSNTTRKLTEAEAKPLLEAGKIQEAAPVEPKRMVDITNADGTKETITWGEYLKRKKQPRFAKPSATVETNEEFYGKWSMKELRDRIELLENAGYQKGSMADEAVQLIKKIIAEKEVTKPKIARGKVEIKIGNKVYQAHEIAGKILPKRPSLPILGEFRVKDGILIATDLEVGIKLKSGLPDGMYKLVGTDAVKTQTDPADFLIVPEVEGKPVFKATTEILQETLKQAFLSTAGKESVRAELTGVSVRVEGNQIIVASTDGFRMYIKKVLAKVSGEGEFILSNPDKVQKVITSLGGLGELTAGKDAIKITGDNGEVYARKIDGDFPAYKQIIPNYVERLSLPGRKEFIAALKTLKPFADYTKAVHINYKDGKLIMSANNEKEGADRLEKTIEFNASTPEKVDVAEHSINNGVILMPIRQETGAKAKYNFNIDFTIDALNALDEDNVYLYSGKDVETPLFFSNERDLRSEVSGKNKVIAKGTKLFHGTTKNNAASIISDGLNRTEDETATYGRAVYLTPDYTTAQNYADEQGEGQVITMKSLKDLNLYEPTIAEREDLIDKTGEAQDELIKKILPTGFDGFYIPDDGRGDGGEQVILYDDNPYLFEKPELADEIRTGKQKTVPPTARKKKGAAGIASMGGAKLGEYEILNEQTIPGEEGYKTWKQTVYVNENGDEITASEGRAKDGETIPDNYSVRLASGKYITKPSEVSPGHQQVIHYASLSEAKKALQDFYKKPQAPSGMASVGGDTLGNYEDIAGIENKTPEQFKIYEEVKALVQKYAKSIGEDYLPRNAMGVFYPETTNVRIKGLNHLSVAAHEITHFLDTAFKISKRLMGIKGYSIAGNPIYEADTAKLRKELTALYEQYYPGARHDHPLQKRMLEGFATLLEKYSEQPSTITATYPNVVREFLTTEGKYYEPVMGDIIKDLREIVAKYQSLSALDKTGARVVSGKVNVNKDSFLNFGQKFKTFIADNIYPLEVLAKKAGVHFTKADPSFWVRQYNNSNAIINNNLNGNRGYWGWRNGELIKLHDFNWKDLITSMENTQTAEQFAHYLVARREYFMYQELENTEDETKKAEIKKILDADGFTEAEVTEAYLENKVRFAEFEKKYDTLVKEDLNFLNDQSVGLVDNEQYKQLTSREGYASFKRYFYDEVVGEEETAGAKIRFGTTKVSSLIRRTGSQKPIINPLMSAYLNHAEITRKGLKQIVYNRIADIAVAKPEIDLFQRLQLKGIPDRQGRILYPQEKDPNIIMARLNYKRVPILTDSLVKRTVDEVLNFQTISGFEKLLMGSSRFFTKGTTGLFPGFALTNYTVDQVTAMAQTRENYRPLYDPLHAIALMLNKNKPEHAYLQEYMVMGGERQTFVGWQDMSPNELMDAVRRERGGLLKVVDGLNKGVSVLAIPSQWSEIMTRATEYIKAREAGKSPIVGLEEAGRVTAPFHHIGRWGGGRVGQVYIKSIPFFNPAIQVLSQAAETLETPEGRQRYAMVTLAITAASIGSLGLIMAYGSDDQKRLFADINPDELNKYIWLPDPTNSKRLIKIRVPDQMLVFATLANMVWADKKLQANYSAGEYLNGAMAWLPAQFDVSQPAKMLMAWIPQIIKPGVLTLAGVKDFPKIMPLESQTVSNRAPEYRYNEQTSPVAKWLGKTFGLSPIKIDYLLTGYVGRASGFLTGKPGIYNPFKSMSREYYFTSGRKLQTYYELKEKNDQDYDAYKKGRKDYGLGERTAILKLRAELKGIGNVIDLYKDVDEEKNPAKADRLKNKIIILINKL